MNKRRRNYIKENGRNKLREMSNKRTPPKPIVLDQFDYVKQIGELCKVWSPTYCTWVWEASCQVNGLILRKEFCEPDPLVAVRWSQEKFKAISNPRFATMMQAAIANSEFTIEDIADAIGISKNGISKWISGDTHPTVPSLLRLCKMLYPIKWEEHYLTLSKVVEMERI